MSRRITWPGRDPGITPPGAGVVVDLPPFVAGYAGGGTLWARLFSERGPGLRFRWLTPWDVPLFSARRRGWVLGPLSIRCLAPRWSAHNAPLVSGLLGVLGGAALAQMLTSATVLQLVLSALAAAASLALLVSTIQREP